MWLSVARNVRLADSSRSTAIRLPKQGNQVPFDPLHFFSYLPRSPFQRSRPGIPIELKGFKEAALGLRNRRVQLQPALDGLSRTYTIGDETAPAKDFLFGTSPDRIKTGLDLLIGMGNLNPVDVLSIFSSGLEAVEAELSPLIRMKLDSFSQYDISLTEYLNAHQDAQPQFNYWESTLTDPDVADRAFWPMMANNGIAYNLLFLKKATAAELATLKPKFGPSWDAGWDNLSAAGDLYFIDLSIFSEFPPQTEDQLTRFTPGTITLLKRDPVSKDLLPIAIRVAGYKDSNHRVFVRAQFSNQDIDHWMYALQAAKTSATVYGIWLGHVYHWHIVTAAVIKGMTGNLKSNHRLSMLLGPQSNSLLQFNEILLLTWGFIAPPTSFTKYESFLDLLEKFSLGRQFYDDDPTTALRQQNILREDFTSASDWDKYPIAGYLLEIYEMCQEYVDEVVEASYPNNNAVVADKALGRWLSEVRDKRAGNIKGLPTPRNKTALKRFLTSMVYRLTAHGCSRLRTSLSPTLSYISNFPVCLQNHRIPRPGDQNIDLLDYLPRTGTIGLMTRFYDLFIYSDPYESFIPAGGVNQDLYFGSNATDRRNLALINFRQRLIRFMDRLQPVPVQHGQWPRCIET